jgi:hypothetical protein
MTIRGHNIVVYDYYFPLRPKLQLIFSLTTKLGNRKGNHKLRPIYDSKTALVMAELREVSLMQLSRTKL